MTGSIKKEYVAALEARIAELEARNMKLEHDMVDIASIAYIKGKEDGRNHE